MPCVQRYLQEERRLSNAWDDPPCIK